MHTLERRPRIIPILLIEDRRLIKTIKFSKPKYLGDPINAIRIFNEKGVDELCIIDKSARKNKKGIDFDYLKLIASEAFMPLSYAGGINTLDDIKRIIKIGFEKVILNTQAFYNPSLITEASTILGSQSVVVSIDYKKDLFHRYHVYIKNGTKKLKLSPLEFSMQVEKLGAGEILLTSIDHEGTMSGFDKEVITQVSKNIEIPVIASGGASSIKDLYNALHECNANAVAASSMFVYYGKNKAVLINFPEENELYEGGVYFK